RNAGQEQRRTELAFEVAATHRRIEGVARCGIELHPRGRKLAALVHADHDAARALLIEASVLYDKFHKRLRRWTLRSACSLPYAAREHAKDFTVEQLAHHLVFVARVDVRVDVDLDEIDAV